MIYVGCHVNVVNLRKAITADMRKRGELFLLVEFAHFGNLRSYLRDRRGSLRPTNKEFGRQDVNSAGLVTIHWKVEIKEKKLYAWVVVSCLSNHPSVTHQFDNPLGACICILGHVSCI